MSSKLFEYKSFTEAKATIFEESNADGVKELYMKGLFIQGDVRNQNQRIYPAREISRAVDNMNKKLKGEHGAPIFGELDHPPELTINLDRVSHLITEMWLTGADGHGKLKIVPTPLGSIVKTLLQSGARLGVSSRGSGNVDDMGIVSDFEIITVDIVAQPSAPNAYPKTIYESLYNMKGGSMIYETARASLTDDKAHKYLGRDIIKLIDELKIK